MKRKVYEKPTTQVVKLQHRLQMLSGSAQVQATMNDTWVEEDDI